MPCPLIGTYVSSVLTHYENPGSVLNSDLLTLLDEALSRSHQEYPLRECLLRRAFKAFEFAYVAIYSHHIVDLMKPPDPRASLETLPAMLVNLTQAQDDIIVFTIETRMANEEIRGRKQLEHTKKERIRLASAVAIPGAQWLLEKSASADLKDFSRVGEMLFHVSKYMAAGLTTQVKYAEELLRT